MTQLAPQLVLGAYVRTSAIIGSVAAGGLGIPGVAVSIGSSETMTDANGQFAFSGLRAGSYTVDISGFDPSLYSFANTSTDVTVAVGESKVVAFSGMLVATATVSGYLFVDENDRNESYDGPLLEDFLAAAGVAIGLEITIGDTIWTETDADGYYEFIDLEAGTYKVIIDADDSDIPAAYSYSMTAGHSMVVSVTTGADGIVHFPFWIITQRVEAAAFLGTDIDVSASPGPGQAPLDGVVIDLYDTEANASAGRQAASTRPPRVPTAPSRSSMSVPTTTAPAAVPTTSCSCASTPSRRRTRPSTARSSSRRGSSLVMPRSWLRTRWTS